MRATALSNVPAARIVRAIASAAERWSDGDFPPRVRILDCIAQRTGYSLPVVEYALDRLFFPVTEAALRAVIVRELGSFEALDAFAPALAAPAGRVCVVSSRTTIGVALWPALFALCAKCDVLVKDREDALVAAFFETLCEELDEFAQAAKAQTWESGAEGAPELRAFDVVVAFGSDATLAAITRTLGEQTRFIPYGSRISAGYVARESLDDVQSAAQLAAAAARDHVLYDAEGCLSLHLLFAERGGACDVHAFTALLDQALEAARVEFPPAAASSTQRALAAFRAANAIAPPRTLAVVAVDGPQDVLVRLGASTPLEAFALSLQRPDLLAMALAAGAVRIARFGEMQSPPLDGHHGGRPRIAEFVKWIDNA